MAKATVEIELPDGYEFDDTRQASSWGGRPDTGIVDVCIPIRRAWKWPEWLKAQWVAMTSDCRWFAFSSQPRPLEYGGWGGDADHLELKTSHFNFTPPQCDDWRTSVRENPNRKQKT